MYKYAWLNVYTSLYQASNHSYTLYKQVIFVVALQEVA